VGGEAQVAFVVQLRGSPCTRKATISQWGGSFFPVYLRPANLSHEAWTREKAAHLWALLPVHRPNPKTVNKKSKDTGAVNKMDAHNLQTTSMKYLTMQLELATRLGVRVVERGTHICTMFPHAWLHMVDRAELAAATGTSYAWLTEYACTHCLVPRSLWLTTREPLAWWKLRARCRAQMILLAQQPLPTNRWREILLRGGQDIMARFLAGTGIRDHHITRKGRWGSTPSGRWPWTTSTPTS